MGYRVIDPNRVEPAPDRPSECRNLSASAGLEPMAVLAIGAPPTTDDVHVSDPEDT